MGLYDNISIMEYGGEKMQQMNFNIEDIEKQDEALTEQKDYSFIENTNVT